MMSRYMSRILTRRCRRFLEDERGANLIEAAVVSVPFFLITFSVAEFGTMMYVKGALQNGVSQATRYGVTGQVFPGMTREESLREAMRQATPTLSIADGAFSFSHIPDGGTTWVSGAGGPSAVERVTVTYSWPTMTPILKPFFGAYTTFVAESLMKNEADLEL